ncbi:MAG: 6-carboxytetrahydropterin synthase [Rikenellaceae bacterium]|nr:6-carboxytetrahydropterin synthase [Rikenellaceae bacterium]
MARIRLTKEFSFESAHALEGYDGKCRHIHGHSYRLYVTIIGEPIADPANPKYGMVMDFGALKALVGEEVVDRMDHAFVMRRTESADEVSMVLSEGFGNVVLVDYQPTCENMLTDFAARISRRLPEGVALHSLKMYETATSFAEWYAEDN